MISVRGLDKRFKSVHALRSVDLDFQAGQVTGVLGPNGCGKTTLIKSMLGLVVPDQGVARVDRRSVGYMPQNTQFPGHLTAAELFDMIEDLRGQPAKRREELIELFEIREHLSKPTGQLSGGTRQKASAVMAFMFNPSILILDEPTVGLDPVAVVRLKSLIREASSQGSIVILVTHMVAEIEQLVQKMYFMLEGQVKFSGTLDEIRQKAGTADLDQAVVKLMSLSYKSDAIK